MTITSAQAQAMLKALQEAVTKTPDKKRKLGQYTVTWQNSRLVQSGDDAPKAVK